MKRIAVVGCPGAGKTTFCRALSKKTGISIIHLDTYYHDKSQPYFEAKNLRAWESKIAELARKEQWIMDGNFGSTFTLRFARADTIIFFDYPRYLCLWRILKRRLQFRSSPRQEMPEDWREKVDYGFLRYVWKFKKQSRHKIIDALPDADTDLIIFKNPNDAKKYFENYKKT